MPDPILLLHGQPGSASDWDRVRAAIGTRAQTIAIEVEQGDTLGRPSSVLASARRGPAGITTRVGGLAVVRDGH